MKNYCVAVENEFYMGFAGSKGFLTDIQNCTKLNENKNYKKLYEDAKQYYPNKNVKLMEVEFILKEVEI